MISSRILRSAWISCSGGQSYDESPSRALKTIKNVSVDSPHQGGLVRNQRIQRGTTQQGTCLASVSHGKTWQNMARPSLSLSQWPKLNARFMAESKVRAVPVQPGSQQFPSVSQVISWLQYVTVPYSSQIKRSSKIPSWSTSLCANSKLKQVKSAGSS